MFRWIRKRAGIGCLFAGIFIPGSLLGADVALDDWQVTRGYSIQADSSGYSLPTSIAFVKNPGSGENDPLYFVSELRGKIKVVTNSREVFDFAQVNTVQVSGLDELPNIQGEVGMAGIHLVDELGYLFVSYVYESDEGELKNAVARFESLPHTFSIKPSARLDILEPFLDHPSELSHQIGPLASIGDQLFVSVGDAEQPQLSRNLDSINGKILRMTFEGDPYQGNIFRQSDSTRVARNYIYASGLRNPFGLKVLDNRLFATDNGPAIDRLVEIFDGRDYGYDGSDWSISINTLASFTPAVSPVQFDYIDDLEGIFKDDLLNNFVICFSGAPDAAWGEGAWGQKSVVTLPYDLEKNWVGSAAKPLLKYAGNGLQLPVGCQIGPDGLYVVPLYPDSNERSAILKISYDPDNEHPNIIQQGLNANALFQNNGCSGCHSMERDVRLAGPSLHSESLKLRIAERISEAGYFDRNTVDNLHSLPELQEELMARRHQIEVAPDSEKSIEWLVHWLLNPKLENPSTAMPDTGLNETEARIVAGALLLDEEGESSGGYMGLIEDPVTAIKYSITNARKTHLVVFGFIAGLLLTVILFACTFLIRKVLFRRRLKRG